MRCEEKEPANPAPHRSIAWETNVPACDGRVGKLGKPKDGSTPSSRCTPQTIHSTRATTCTWAEDCIPIETSVIKRRTLAKENRTNTSHWCPSSAAGWQRPPRRTTSHNRLQKVLGTGSEQNYKSSQHPRSLRHVQVRTINSTPTRRGQPEKHRKARQWRFLVPAAPKGMPCEGQTIQELPDFPTKKETRTPT